MLVWQYVGSTSTETDDCLDSSKTFLIESEDLKIIRGLKFVQYYILYWYNKVSHRTTENINTTTNLQT